MAFTLTFNDVLYAVLGIVIAIIISDAAGYPILDMFNLTRSKVLTDPSGIPRIIPPTESPKAINIEGKYLAVIEASLKDASKNWIAEVQMTGPDKILRIETIKRGELRPDEDSPLELFGSNVTYYKWVKGGVENEKDQQIVDLTKRVRYYRTSIASLETELQNMHMSQESQIKMREALEGVRNRERFRKGPGFGDNTSITNQSTAALLAAGGGIGGE